MTLIWIGSCYGHQRQDKNVAVLVVVIVGSLLLLLWMVLLSRMRWRVRLILFGSAAGSLLLLTALFRIHGVTGDLVPVLRWRWEEAVWEVPDGQAKTGSPDLPGASTNDYPQFLGPHRDGTVGWVRLGRDWKAEPPRRVWLHRVGLGWSGFAVAGNRAITQEQRQENETLNCYDVVSGAALWSYAYPAYFRSTMAGDGPRATPTIEGDRVFALGSVGTLNCVDLQTGKGLWSRDIVGENETKVSPWGMSSSPLVVDGVVVVSAGGSKNRSLVAYHAATGEFVWGGGTDGAGYSSPLLTTLAGVRQILIFNSAGVSAHDPATGGVIWNYPWPSGHPHISVPIVLPDDRLFVSSGYGYGSELLKIQKGAAGELKATRIWKSSRLKSKFANPVFRDGFIYGLDDGTLVCLDAANGELKWKGGRYGHGQQILVGDQLLITAESGELVLMDPNPLEPREVTRFPALRGKTWNPPALAGQYLLVRNDKEAACYRLPLSQP